MKVCFLDRDGVINVDVHFLHKPEDVKIVRSFPSLMSNLHDQGFQFIIVTNQSGLARGYFQWEDFQRTHQEILKQLPHPILKTYVCPHHPEGIVDRFREVCGCRKPEPGLIHCALLEYPQIDLDSSILIGDSPRDCWSANTCGIQSFYLSGKPVGDKGLPLDCTTVDDLCEIPGLI